MPPRLQGPRFLKLDNCHDATATGDGVYTLNVVDRPLLQTHAVVRAAANLSETPAALPERFDGDSLLHRLQDASPRCYGLCLQFRGARQHEEPEEIADLSTDAAAVARAVVASAIGRWQRCHCHGDLAT